MKETLGVVVLTACLLPGLAVVSVEAQTDEPVSWNETAAAAYLDERLGWWASWPRAARENGTFCVSCHTAAPIGLAQSALRAGSPAASSGAHERKLVENVTRRVETWNEIGPYYGDERFGAPKTAESRGTEAILNALVLAHHDARGGILSDRTRKAFDHLWALQVKSGASSGAWPWLNFRLEPWETADAQYYGAALAAVAVGIAPKDYGSSDEIENHLGLLREYLERHHETQNLFNRLTVLWASTRLEGILEPAQRTSIIDDALSRQRNDGGWSLSSLGTWQRRDGTPVDTRSDGYATGLVTFVLQRAGVSPEHTSLERGLSWLVLNQNGADGSWPAFSLNEQREPGSEAARFMRDAATSYAVLALTEAKVSMKAEPGSPARQGDELYVPSRPETVTWGWFPIDRPPVLTIQSGDTVRIDTLSHAGATQNEEPDAFLGALGVEPEEILQDVRDFWASRSDRPRDGRSGHVITGPVYIEGAEPGDMLEVRILALATRVPYGVNNTGPTSGVFGDSYPGARPDDAPLDMGRARHLIRTATVDGREVALFSPSIHVPLAPFMGIMAVAPAGPVVGQPGVTVPGVQSSRPPGAFGGNMDVKDLTAGTTVYLPVFQPGARFYVGDPHSAQGDGEVSGTAIEQSLSGVFTFTLHKGRSIAGPRAETATEYIMMGIDLDLDRALRMAVREVVSFLVEEKGLTRDKAFSLASIAVDFHVAEAVDLTQVVSGKIPKSLFLEP